MKTFPRLSLLAALIATATFSSGAFAASVNGTASATALIPISITAPTALNFGSFATTAAANGGTITLTSGGTRAATGTGVVLSGGQAGAVAGVFTITGSGSAGFAVTYPAGATTLAGPTPGVTAVFGTTAGAGATYGLGSGNLSGGSFTLNVGGILTIPATAVAVGTYSSTYPVIVEYN
ncbi:MAG: DUF4402 domain-containing protein [Polaromonas sp.]|nr:DUF4402 domain-containing protein [Polaromonas sp.]